MNEAIVCNDLPTLQEELDRKVVAALKWLEEARLSGQVSESSAGLGRQMIYQISAGLVDPSIKAIMDSCAIPEKRDREIAILKHGHRLVLLIRKVGSPNVATITLKVTPDNFMLRRFKQSNYALAMARASDYLRGRIGDLKAIGYKEI